MVNQGHANLHILRVHTVIGSSADKEVEDCVYTMRVPATAMLVTISTHKGLYKHVSSPYFWCHRSMLP